MDRLVMAASDLRIPDEEDGYQLVDVEAAAHPIGAYAPLARAHGAVLVAISDDDDPDTIPRYAVLLDLGVVRVRLEGTIAPARITSELGLAALVREEDLGYAPYEPTRVPSPEHLVGYRDASGAYTWEAASWKLVPDPVAQLRDWLWLFEPNYDGVSLHIFVDADRDAIERLLASRGPSPYERTEPHRYQRAGYERNELILVRDGELVFARSHPDPLPSSLAFDADVLAALVDGALGDLEWDVVDDDYLTFLATGRDRASLAALVSPGADRAALLADYARLLEMREIDASAATSEAEVLRIVTAALGAPADAEPSAWFATAPGLPRSLRFRVPRVFVDTIPPLLRRPRTRTSFSS